MVRFPLQKDLPMERLIVSPDADPAKAGKFTACLESTGETIVSGSRQPLADGARELLARGFDPATPLTMRHEGKAHDSFRPAPIGDWARWTYSESETHPLKRRPWLPREMPVAVDREDQKSGIEPSAGIQGHPEDNSLLRLDVSLTASSNAHV
jgi:hypothetical protein